MAYELRISSLADSGDTTVSRIQLLNQDHKPMVEIAGDFVKACLETRAATGSKLGPKKHRERSDGTALPCLREWASDYYTAALVPYAFDISIGLSTGGERGIRTPDTRKGIHAFEARAFSHSAISPRQPVFVFYFIREAVWLEFPAPRFTELSPAQPPRPSQECGL
jgi:hypothetical protein